MFENLTEKLERSFKILKGEGRITEINVAETLKEIRRALIDADVNYKVAKTFTDEVKQKALGQDVLRSVKPGQMMTKMVPDSYKEINHNKFNLLYVSVGLVLGILAFWLLILPTKLNSANKENRELQLAHSEDIFLHYIPEQ